MNITSFGHAAIKVRDLDASEAFYSGILRMPVAARFPQQSEAVIVGLRAVSCRCFRGR